jgi:outer membrane protein OmpA-like peptidoglycan-associated protein
MTGSYRTAAVMAIAAAFAAGLAGCSAGRALKEQGQAVQATVKSAKEFGSAKCMPKETAIGEANADFAVDEAYDGNYYASQKALALAKPNADAALEFARNNPDKCLPPKVIVKPAPKPIVQIDWCKVDSDGDTIPDCEDKCPNDPGFIEYNGCPVPPDMDGDLILDKVDRCPNIPGLTQFQGCPDTDGDVIPDPDDKCPFEAGVPNTDDPSRHGCPPYTLVVVKKGIIEIKEQVHFETGKSIIKPDSFELLHQVAQVMKNNPAFNVEVQGHTDSVGGKKYNQKLSESRANAVRDHLIRHEGIEPGRLTARGFGMDRPIASNGTAMGKAQNRRSEFHIVSGQDAGGKKDEPVPEVQPEVKPPPKPKPKAKPKPQQPVQ